MNRSDICVTALSDCFRGDDDILVNPIGISPIIGGRLAKATHTPDCVMTDAVSVLNTALQPIGVPDAPRVPEAYVPYRTIFDIVWSGRRHVMMGATQIDKFGNQNIASIGDPKQPKSQLLGLRGSPGNLINHVTSYWVPRHSTRAFVDKVDVVSGPGYDRMAELGAPANRFHHVRFVVSNLGVFNFENDDNRMQVVSLHPGVTIDEVAENTSFEMVVPDDIPESRVPTSEELDLMEQLDPNGMRHNEVPG